MGRVKVFGGFWGFGAQLDQSDYPSGREGRGKERDKDVRMRGGEG